MVSETRINTEKSEWHENTCQVYRGKTGKAEPKVIGQYRWRRNGATKRWATRPGQFSVPIKHGLRGHYYITHENQYSFHDADKCKADAEVRAYWDAKMAEVAVAVVGNPGE